MRLSLVFLLALAAGLGACSTLDRQPEPEPVVLQLKWRHQFQFAGYYAAVQQGFYRDAGLEVTLREADEGQDPVDAVVSGEATYGVGSSGLLLARAEGKPVVALAAVYQHSPYAIVTLYDSDIDRLEDLAGRRLMLEPQAAELEAYLREAGIDASELELVPHSFDISALRRREVDAMSAYVTDEVFALRDAGLPYRAFSARDAGIDFYGDVLFTSSEELEARPDRVAAFVEASLKGWEYALAHPQKMARLIHEFYSARHSLAHLGFEAEQSRDLIAPEGVAIGQMEEVRWRAIADTYAGLGMLPADFSLDGFLYRPALADTR